MSYTKGPYTRITSRKHPGAVFFKEKGTRSNFICKVYPDHDDDAQLYEAAPALLEAAQKFTDNFWQGDMSLALKELKAAVAEALGEDA